MNFELVVNKIGGCFYHLIGDQANLGDPNNILAKIPFNFDGQIKRYPLNAYYIYTNKCHPNSPIFSSLAKLEQWMKNNGIKYDAIHHRQVCQNKVTLDQ